jgi:hypothetical protein
VQGFLKGISHFAFILDHLLRVRSVSLGGFIFFAAAYSHITVAPGKLPLRRRVSDEPLKGVLTHLDWSPSGAVLWRGCFRGLRPPQK